MTPTDLSQTDLAAERRRAWLASLLLQRHSTWFGRFTLRLRQLTGLRRGQRRRLQRKAAVSLAGAALVLSLGAGMMRPMTVHAASITVDDGIVAVADDGQCSLIEAILNANGDSALYATVGECVAGSGADTINLPASGLFTLTGSYSYQAYSDTGLPPIDSVITIEGNSSEITRDGAAPTFRIMAVSASGDLTLKSTTLSNGSSQEDGGGLYNEGYALLQNSQIIRNYAYDDGGGAENDGGTLIIEDSNFEFNEAGNDGGGIANEDGGNLTIIGGSQISNNSAYESGGGVYQDDTGGPIVITNSGISGNTAEKGGGLSAEAGIGGGGGGLITISGTVIRNNTADIAGGGIATFLSTIIIQDESTISGNKAYYGGGAGFYFSDVTITDSDISGNTAYYEGGGLRLEGSTVTIERSTLTGNNGAYYGGGVAIRPGFGEGEDTYSDLTIVDSTLSGNSSLIGGALFNSDGNGLTILNSTLSDNTAAVGGGLLNLYGRWLIANSTISGNEANATGGFGGGYGGGIWNVSDPVDSEVPETLLVLSTVTGNSATNFAGGMVNLVGGFGLFASIVSGNSAPSAGEIADYVGGIYSFYNILGDAGKTTAQAVAGLVPSLNLIATSDDANIPLTDILDTTLADNGGPTETHALVSGSPAIDILPDGLCAPNSIIGVDLDFDQRGEPRNVDIPGTGNDGGSDLCDIGAFELQEAVAGFCPLDDPAVGYLRTDLLGVGQGSPTKGVRTRKLVLPNYQDVASLYGQLASVESGGIMKYVRFRYPNGSFEQIHAPTSPAYRTFAVNWWGSELDTGYQYIKGQFFWGAKGNKTPRAFVLWPTYDTDEAYANVLATFDDSSANHAAWETGFFPVQQQTLEIPATTAAGADVSVSVALVDVNKDARSVILTVEAGGVTESRVVTVPTDKDLLNLEEFLLEGVDAGTDEVVITLESPLPGIDFPFGGDSAAMIGAAANYECGEIEPQPAFAVPDTGAPAFDWSALLEQARLQRPAGLSSGEQPAFANRAADGRWFDGLSARPAGHGQAHGDTSGQD